MRADRRLLVSRAQRHRLQPSPIRTSSPEEAVAWRLKTLFRRRLQFARQNNCARAKQRHIRACDSISQLVSAVGSLACLSALRASEPASKLQLACKRQKGSRRAKTCPSRSAHVRKSCLYVSAAKQCAWRGSRERCLPNYKCI